MWGKPWLFKLLKNILRKGKYWFNGSTNRSIDHKECNIPWLVNFNHEICSTTILITYPISPKFQKHLLDLWNFFTSNALLTYVNLRDNLLWKKIFLMRTLLHPFKKTSRKVYTSRINWFWKNDFPQIQIVTPCEFLLMEAIPSSGRHCFFINFMVFKDQLIVFADIYISHV